MHKTDEALMLAVKDGDLQNLGLLFERHHRNLFRFFYGITRSRSTADDLVQEVFFRILKYRGTFRTDSRFTTWMFQIARNARLDFLKKEGSSSRDDTDADIPEIGFDPHEFAEREADARLLEQALLYLSEEKRQLLNLARYQELKYDEVADILQIQAGTVKVRVHRVLKELREIFLRLSKEKTHAL